MLIRRAGAFVWLSTLSVALPWRVVAAPAPPARSEAAEMAKILALEETVRALHDGSAHDGAARRQDVVRRVLQASFEIDSAVAQIQQEQAALADVSNAIQSERDARVGLLNVGAGVLGVGAAVGTGMTLNDSTTTAGIWVTTITSGIGAAIAIYAAAAPSRGTAPVRVASNMLAPLFGRPLSSGRYPPIVWTYLTSVPPDAAADRRRQLVSEWTTLGLVAEGSSPDALERIDGLCRPIVDRRAVDVDLLQARSQMLSDVRATVAEMKEGLLALLDSIGVDGERLSTDEDRAAPVTTSWPPP